MTAKNCAKKDVAVSWPSRTLYFAPLMLSESVGILHFRWKTPRNGYLSINLDNKNMTEEKKLKFLFLNG